MELDLFRDIVITCFNRRLIFFDLLVCKQGVSKLFVYANNCVFLLFHEK